MENEILWKWELLCGEFDQARQNYLDHFAPLINTLSCMADCSQSKANQVQIRHAEHAWNSWVDIQIKIKEFVEKEG